MEEYVDDSFAVNLEGALWVPYKEVFRVVNSTLYRKHADIQELEVMLRTYKLDFKRLLKNPPKRPQSREAIKKASSEGIRILGQQAKRILPQAVVDEALIISDLFDLNEIVALELLLMGESQMSRLSVATRGLAAVLLYYDGRRCLVNSLRALIQVRDGRCWTLGLPRDVTEIVTTFTDDLWEEGLCEQILGHLETFDLYSERERLESKQALGDLKHRRQVFDLQEEIQLSLAECIYCWACQSGLKRSHLLQLMHILANTVPSQGDGHLSDIHMTLLMAFMYSVDLGLLSSFEDSDDAVQSLPLIADNEFLEYVYKELNTHQAWKCQAMKSAMLFAWVVSVRTISHIPSLQGGLHQQYTEEDFLSNVVDDALKGNALPFLSDMVVGNKRFFNEEFFIRRLHGIVTDFINFFPLKVKELRNRGDEIARILSHNEHTAEGTTSPVIYFQHFLELVASLYSRDKLQLKLNEEYWCPNDIPGQLKLVSSFSTHKQVKLFKFVRLAGDLLPPLLYVPYINMLCSLSASPVSAHHCYNLLRLNGPLIAGTHYSIVSWDHFFNSLHRYFASLRQEQQGSGLQQRQGIPLGITPQEIEGLRVVLKLIKTVVQYDEVARVAICGNSDWSAVNVLLGLLNCGVPLVLKAQLMLTISALVKTPDVAVKVWLSMENAHILPSISEDGVISGTIQMELEEVESYCEEYPLTGALLETLCVLVDTFQSISTIGVQTTARFLPCVIFVINNVLSKFQLRSYKYAEEKWRLASLSLGYLLKLVSQSDLSFGHLKSSSVQAVGSDLLKLSAGHFIIANMLQNSLLLKTVLHVVDEVSKVLDQYISSFPGKEDMEMSALLSLKLIQYSLENQEGFTTSIRENNISVLLTGLDQLIMGINPRTNKADNLVKIARYISYSDTLPEHAFYAASILSLICRSSVSQERVLGSFSVDEVELNNLLRSLVQCLESEDLEDDLVAEFVMSNELEGDSLMRGSIRRTILQMLIYCLRLPPPNLALFLLGFHLSKTPQKVVLQDPGVLDSMYTCLHASLDILFRENSNNDLIKTSELCQQLIFTMCAHRETSGPTLRYLRTSHDFLYRQLKMIPFKLSTTDGVSYEVNLLNRQGWLLKTIAIELRVAAISGQRSNLQRLTALLLDRSTVVAPELGNSRCKLLSILSELDLKHAFPKLRHLEFFDLASLERVMSECERPTSSGFFAVDLQNLHNLLLTEISNFQSGLSLAQRPVITKELHEIVKYAWQRNQAKLHLQSKKQSLEAWRLVTEMVLATLSAEVIDDYKRVTVILELAHTFLHKVLEESSVSELVNPTSNVLPPLFSNLRQCFVSASKSLTSVSQPLWKPYSSSLEATVHNLIACILQAGGGHHKVRANYYCALLNLLKIFSSGSDLDVSGHEEVHALTADHFVNEKFMHKCMDVIRGYGSSFFEILCRDACNSSDVTKMLAICCLSLIVSNDRQQSLLEFMASKGYVQDFVNRLQADDRYLSSFSSCSPTSFRKLYVYEAKMAFFVHLAGSAQGARHLMCCGLIKCLANMQALDSRPEQFSGIGGGAFTDADTNTVWLDSKTYYHHILVPALRLCLLLVNSSSGMVLDIRFQAIQFLVSHVDVLSTILREHHHSLIELQQLSLITALFARVFPSADYFNAVSPSDSGTELYTHTTHLHRLARSFLPALVSRKMKSSNLSYKSVNLISNLEEEETIWSEAVVCLLYFYTNIVRNSGFSALTPPLLFGPKMKDASLPDVFGQDYPLMASKDVHQMPDLGILVFLLQYGIKRIIPLLNDHKCRSQGLGVQEPTKGIWRLGNELDSGTPLSDPCSSQQGQLKSRSLLICMIENAVYLLWHHLEFYLIQSTSPEEKSLQGQSSASIRIRRLHDNSITEPPGSLNKTDWNSTWYPSREDVTLLKADCHSTLNDAFMEKLNEVIELLDYMKEDQFLRVIVRRLRWLIALPSV